LESPSHIFAALNALVIPDMAPTSVYAEKRFAAVMTTGKAWGANPCFAAI
jgi:hypothetical protein